MTDQLITHLADVIRRYNMAPYGSGGGRTIGTLILQRGTKRIPLEHKRIPDEWPKDSTVPEDVADILLSIQFDQKKAVASLFDTAEAVTRFRLSKSLGFNALKKPINAGKLPFLSDRKV